MRPLMRIAFLGTPDFALPALEVCHQAGELVIVVAQPDKPAGRDQQLRMPATKAWALVNGIPVAQPEKVKQGKLAAVLDAVRPDVAVTAAYGRILPADALNVPRHGCLNVHASLLPELRGAAPAQWAIARGYRQTGVTIMQMDEGLDTGDIRLQRPFPIAEGETGGSLLRQLSLLGADALAEALLLLKEGRLPRVPQDHSKATSAPLLTRDDGRVDWARTAEENDARRRGFTPWPGAWTTLDGAVVKIHSARPVSGVGVPGELISGTTFACGNGTAWELREVQPEGKKRMAAAAWLQGARLKPGHRLGT
jgi:methionyl-tRNA formyltransferase